MVIITGKGEHIGIPEALAHHNNRILAACFLDGHRLPFLPRLG